MPKPILYYVPLSPPARAALLTAREIELDIEVKWVETLSELNVVKFIKVS